MNCASANSGSQAFAPLRDVYRRLVKLFIQRTRPEVRDLYLRPLLTLPRGARILDAGGGTGHDSVVLAREGYQVTCVDLSEDMCAVAREALAAHGATVIEGDVSRYKPLEPFSAVLSAMEIVHHSDLFGIIRHYSNMLLPGGMLVLVTHHPLRNLMVDQTRSYFEEGLVQEDWGPYGIVPSYRRTLKSYLAAIKEAGLRLIDLEEHIPTTDLAAIQDQSITAKAEYPSLMTFICVK